MRDARPDRRQVLAALSLASAAGPAGRSSDPATMLASSQRGPGQYRIEDFGAVGDGRSDDSAAFERALASISAGAILLLSAGRQYRLTRSLVFTRPVMLCGGTKEHTRLIFDDGHYAKLGGQHAALILPHERSGEAGNTARRTVLSGFSIVRQGRRSGMLHGCLIAAPVYLSEVDVNGFEGNGFHVEAESGRIRGNANGGSFMNCSAKENVGHGFFFYGNDANACLLLGARAFDNRKDGFHDASLLGNTYVASEADGNLGAGYASIKTTPNRSIFIGCYAEPSQRYDLNKRNVVLGGLGHFHGQGGVMARALPSGDLFSRMGQVFAPDEESATSGAASLRISSDGLDLRHGDGQRVRLMKLLSANYVDILNGDQPLIRFPARQVAGNVSDQRPWLPAGFAVGDSGHSAIVGAGTAPPRKGQFAAGALWLNEAPEPGGFVGWICVASGQPGRWYSFGRIETNS